MSEDIIIDSKILSRILLLQSTLQAVPDEKHLSETVVRGLAALSCITGCVVCLQGTITKMNDNLNVTNLNVYSEICELWNNECTNTCHYAKSKDWQELELQTINNKYGAIFILFEDTFVFKPYLDFIDNTANLIALYIENKNILNELKEANIKLNSSVNQKTKILNDERILFNTLMDNIPDHIYFKDIESRYVAISKSLANNFNLNDPAQAIGQTDFDFFTEKHANIAFKCEQSIIETGESIVGIEEKETLLNRPDLWVSSTKLPMYDKQGNIVGTFGISRDITKQKQTEESLKYSEEQFSKAFKSDLMIMAISKLDDDSYIEVNQTFVNVFGYSEEELVGTASVDLGLISMKDRENLKAELISCGRVDGMELLLKKKSGEKVFCKYFGELVTIDGEQRLLTIAQDITEQKKHEKENKQKVSELEELNKSFEEEQSAALNLMEDLSLEIKERMQTEQTLLESEERFRSVIESAAEAIISINAEGIIIGWNKTAVRMFEYSSKNVLGENVIKLVPERYRDVHKAKHSLAVTSKFLGDSFNRPVQISGLKKNGNEFPIEISLSSWTIRDNLYFTALISDITARKKSEEELNLHRENLEVLVDQRTLEINHINEQLKNEFEKQIEAEKRVKKALKKEQEVNELKTRFISTVSHEIRTPLTAIKSSSDLLGQFGMKWTEEKKKEHLGRISLSVDHLVYLLENILTISRAESGKISFSPKNVDVLNIVEEVTNRLKFIDDSKHIIKVSFNGDRKDIISDGRLLRLIFENIVSNSIKYSKNNTEIIINVNLADKLSIEISDKGIGIPEEGIKHLFEPFYRAENAEDYKGSGLGLAIVDKMVEILGGKITVESKLGAGTKFNIILPINYVVKKRKL